MDNPNKQLSGDLPTQQITPKFYSRSKIPIFILIFIILLVIMAGLYLLSTKIAKNQQKQSALVPTIIQKSPTPISDITANWKTLDIGLFTLKCPSSCYVSKEEGNPTFDITDSKTTYDLYVKGEKTFFSKSTSFMIQGVSLSLDRRIDPGRNPNLLATPEQALQRAINWDDGKPYLVNASTNVPWENANGGTDDGRKYFLPHVPYENAKLGNTNAPKVGKNNGACYYILYSDQKGYLRLCASLSTSTSIKILNQILSTVKFTDDLFQTTDASNWKTYKNEKYGIEFKYPENLYKVHEIDSNQYSIEYKNPFAATEKYYMITISIAPGSNLSLEKPEQLFENVFGKDCVTQGNIIYETKLGEQKAFRRNFCYGGEDNTRPANIITIRNNKLYSVDVDSYGNFKENPNETPIYDQILSTFKFSDTTSSP